MKIVHVDTGREMRGGQRQVLLLARGLRERGHEQVILARRDGPLYQACLAEGFDTRPSGALPVAGITADVVHAHDARAHLLAITAPRLVVSRRVAFPVGSSVLSRWKYRRASRYLAVSEYVRGQLLIAGVPADRVAVVYDGVAAGPPPPFGARENVVVAPATGDPEKGDLLAAEACRLAGAALRLSSDLARDLPRAALFLYLTRSEGLGSAILLAMSLGAPVIASRVGGIPEVIEHRGTGLLVENRASAVADAIRAVLAEPDQARRLAESAYRRVLERFPAAKMVAQTEEAYQLVLSQPT